MTSDIFMILTIILLSIIAGTLIGILISLRRINKFLDSIYDKEKVSFFGFKDEVHSWYWDLAMKLKYIKENLPDYYEYNGNTGKLYHKKRDDEE